MKNHAFARSYSILLTSAVVAAVSVPALADIAPITFGPGDYDNTANTVSGTTPTNNQTTGNWRDVFWWQINNGQPKDGSADFINQGNALILQANHAVPGPGPITALNFTGPAVSSNPGHQTYMSIYDTTPADGTATRSLFDASAGLTIEADVMFVKHSVSGGIVGFYTEGQEGLALMASNGDGNNPDVPKMSLIWQSQGNGTVLESVSLPFGTFVPFAWYRVSLTLNVSGDSWSADGTIYNHVTPADPSSALNTLLWSIHHDGSLSDPDLSALVLTNPGEIGVIAQGNESIALPDNVGVSITNFTTHDGGGGETPEPASLGLLALGAMGLIARRRR